MFRTQTRFRLFVLTAATAAFLTGLIAFAQAGVRSAIHPQAVPSSAVSTASLPSTGLPSEWVWRRTAVSLEHMYAR